MFTWGWNQNSQLGHGDSETRIMPQEVIGLQGKEVVSLACGSRFTIAATSSGSVYTWGRGDDGQLGHPRSGLVTLPRLIESLQGVKIVALAARGSHCLALSADCQVYSWGRGDEGQLGQGRGVHDRSLMPALVCDLEDVPIKAIGCGRQHSVALAHTGQLFTWGCNDDGALGQGKASGSLWTPHPLSALDAYDVEQVACGSRHTIVVASLTPSVGVSKSTIADVTPEDAPMPARVSSHESSSVLLAFGWNIYGQLGVGDFESRFEPVPVLLPGVSPGETIVKSLDGSSIDNVTDPLAADQGVPKRRPKAGSGSSRGFPAVASSFQAVSTLDIVTISVGYRHSFVVVRRRDEETTDADKSAGGELALLGWGWNRYGQLGTLPQRTTVHTPVFIDALPLPLHSISAGGRHTTAVLRRPEDGALRLFAWGRGDDGQLGTGELANTHIPGRVRLAGCDIELIACGWSHSAASIYSDTHEGGPDGTTEGGDIEMAGSKQLTLSSVGRMQSLAFRPGVSATSTPASKFTRYTRVLREIFSYGNIDCAVAQWLNCLILLLMIVSSVKTRAGLSSSLIVGAVIPGAAFTVFLSNTLFAAWADFITRARTAAGEPNAHVTALPHGLNTVIFFAYTMLIMGPVYDKTGSALLAYRTSLFATFLLGVLEIPSILFVNWLRRTIPRAAMMSALAGVSLTFISMTFALQIFETPSLSLLPLIVILITYAAHVQLPLKIPSGIAAMAIGTFIAWSLRWYGINYFDPPIENDAGPEAQIMYLPKPAFGLVWDAIQDPMSWQYITVVLPMLLVNIVSNLACVESASTVGDHYSAPKALLLDALLTIVGSLFGCPFPTCIYIGHPAFKAMGARTGYNYINAVLVLFLGVFDGATTIMRYVPEVAGVGLLMWIGIVVTASSFDRDETQEQSNKSHAAAVALGLVPALAAWCLQNIEAVIRAVEQVLPGTPVMASITTGSSGSVMATIGSGLANTQGRVIPFDKLVQAVDTNGVFMYGMISLSRGYLLSSIYLASTLVHIIERQFYKAAMWMFVAAALSFVGAVHSFAIDESGVTSSYGFPSRGPEEYALQYTTSYCCAGVLLLMFEIRESDRSLSGWRDHIWRRVAFSRIGKRVLPKYWLSSFDVEEISSNTLLHRGRGRRDVAGSAGSADAFMNPYNAESMGVIEEEEDTKETSSLLKPGSSTAQKGYSTVTPV